MSHSKTEIAIGAGVLTAALIFLFVLIGQAGVSGGSNDLILKASFRSADGVSPGTDVRMAGVKVGTVQSMELDPSRFRAELELALRNDLKIPDDSGVAISQDGLLGGSFVEIIPGGSDFAMENGAEFFETQPSVSLINLLLKFVAGQGE